MFTPRRRRAFQEQVAKMSVLLEGLDRAEFLETAEWLLECVTREADKIYALENRVADLQNDCRSLENERDQLATERDALNLEIETLEDKAIS
jgi:chromosome segregation ATPase